MVLGVEDAIHDRVTHVEVRVRHIDLGAQRARAVGELAVLHALEQVEVLLHRPVAPGAVLARLRQGAAILSHLLRGQIAHIRPALADEDLRPLIKLLEVIGGEEQTVTPIPAEPADALHDGIHELGLFLDRVGVVKAQVALAAVLLRDAEVNPDRLGVTDVQIAVGLRREARADATAETASAIVLFDRSADEVQRCGGVLGGHGSRLLLLAPTAGGRDVWILARADGRGKSLVRTPTIAMRFLPRSATVATT